MSIYKRGRYWHYDFQIDGQRFYGPTKIDAKRKAQAFAKALRQEAIMGRLGRHATMTLGEGADRWWLEVGRHLRTAAGARKRLDVLLRLIGRDTLLRDISSRTVAHAIEKRRSETFCRAKHPLARGARTYPIKNATVNADIVTMLSRVLNRAEKVWEVRSLPVINWQALRLPEPPLELRLYTPAQQEAWAAQCDPTTRLALAMLLTYGMRFGELFFPLDAFDPAGPDLVINKRKRGGLLLPLRHEDARVIGERVSQARAGGCDTIWFDEVCEPAGFDRPAQSELKPLKYAALQTRLRKAAQRSGLTAPRVIHGARHHAATILLRDTGNLRLAQQMLGHADIKSTMRYAGALHGQLRAALEAKP